MEMNIYTLIALIFICLAVLMLIIRWTWSGIYYTRLYKEKRSENLRSESAFGTLSLITVIAAALAIIFYFIGYAK